MTIETRDSKAMTDKVKTKDLLAEEFLTLKTKSIVLLCFKKQNKIVMLHHNCKDIEVRINLPASIHFYWKKVISNLQIWIKIWWKLANKISGINILITTIWNFPQENLENAKADLKIVTIIE